MNKIEFNRNLRGRLLSCGFKAKGETLTLILENGSHACVTFRVRAKNRLQILSGSLTTFEEHHDLTFEEIRGIILRQASQGLEVINGYDWESCIVRLGRRAWVDNDSQVQFDPEIELEADRANYNTLPSLKAVNSTLAMTQLCTIIQCINEDFPKDYEEEARLYPYWCPAYEAPTHTVSPVNPFEIHTDAGYEAFIKEPSNIELLKQFQGIK